MIENQNITHVRGKDLVVPVTVTLDQSRTLAGTETWKWVLKLNVTTAVLLTLTDAGGGITNASPFQPALIFTPADFPIGTFPDKIQKQTFLHALEMTKDGKKEAVMRGFLFLLSDIVDP